jgi:hypothetical protein
MQWIESDNLTTIVSGNEIIDQQINVLFFHPKIKIKIGEFLVLYIFFLKSQTIPLEDRTKHNPNKHNHRYMKA